MAIKPSELYQELELLPYQSAFAAKANRFKIGLWARQTGKDHTVSAEAVIDCMFNPGTSWSIIGASERQALETLAKARTWADILKFEISDYIEAPGNLPFAEARATSTEIHWSNGSRLIALPAKPSTVRGFTSSLILTEFAFHENADEIWKAAFPYITNPLTGIKKLRIISTPNGLNNKFARLWIDGPGFALADPYLKSKVSIHDAIKCGLPINADELRAGLGDEEAWSQEYLCEFIDSSTVMFPYDLIAPCESEQALETNPELSTINPQPQLYAGIDFGRKHHLTVCWIMEAVPAPAGLISTPQLRSPQLFITREVLCLKNTSTPEQFEILLPRLKRCRKICLDYTGSGIGLGDYLAKEFNPNTPQSQLRSPHCRLDLCSFTPALKGELYPKLKTAFEQRSLRIPISRDIREDLHAVHCTVTQHGQIGYRAPQSPNGHSDRTTALALALRAATSTPPSCGATSVWVPGRTADLRWANLNRRSSRSIRRRF